MDFTSKQQQLQQAINNQLVNESERNDTIANDIVNSSVFDKSFNQATTFDSGKLIPILMQEVYPGDIYDIDVKQIIRLSAPASNPLMNINYDVNFFFIPYSQLDKQFYQLMGENNDYGYSNTTINLPCLNANTGNFKYNENDLGNYFNIPINTRIIIGETINLYPFLAYGKVWNEWYRDQNLQSCIDITTCFKNRIIYDSTYSDSMDFKQSIIYGKGLAPTSKLPSYFTSCLPYQQKGLPINIGNNSNTLYVDNNTVAGNYRNLFSPKVYFDGGQVPTADFSLGAKKSSGNMTMYDDLSTKPSTGNNAYLDLVVKGDIFPTINELRYSIVSQHLLENFALCGSRYVEQLKSIWGISIDPKNINRTELIGGYNDTLIYNNIMQTSQTSGSSQLGKLATNLYNALDLPHISYASSQHGLILGLMTCRTPINNGGQGMPKIFNYENYLDFFNPMFNGIGEQPILNKEIFYDKDYKKNANTFGFNEPFLNTKYNIDNANGFFSLNSNTSLFPMYLFGEKYTQAPLLNDAFIRYNPNIIGNTLYNVSAGNKEFYHQFISFISFNIKYTTKQPLFNTPKVYGI